MSVTLTQLDAPQNPVGSAVAGGNLDPSTTYYYKIIAFGTFNDLIYSDIISAPSATVTVTTTSTNKSVELSWDAVTGATRYIIVRVEDPADFDVKTLMFLQSGSYPLYINGTSYTDTGSTTLMAYPVYYEYGMPQVVIDAGTTEDLDSLADWAETNGYTQHFSRQVDEYYGRGIVYKFSGYLVIAGTFNCATTGGDPFGAHLFIDGGWKIESTGTWNIGTESFTQGYYIQPNFSISRTGKYSVFFMNGGMNWFNTTYYDMGLNDRNFMGLPSRTSHGIVRPNHANATINIQRCLIPYLGFEFYNNYPTGQIRNCVWSGLGTPNSLTVMEDITLCNGAGVYNYYVTRDVYMKGLKFNQSSPDMQFHRTTSENSFYFVDGEFYNDPPRGNKITRPENLIVYDCKSFNLQIIDINGDPIEGATVTVTDTLGNEIVMTSDDDGNVYRAGGTATSSTSNTLTDSSLSLDVDAIKTHLIEIVEGTGSGQERVIQSHTSDTFTIEGTWDTNPDATSVYRVECFLKVNRYQGNDAKPNPYCYDTVNYNPYSFKFEKTGYATTILSDFVVGEKMDWVIILKTAEEVDDPTTTFYHKEIRGGTVE